MNLTENTRTTANITIKIDGNDIRHLSANELRHHFGVVPQETILFSGTLYANLLMAKLCRPALLCERLRAEVFAGKRSPLIFGEPEAWVGWMVQANQLDAQGDFAPAADLRQRALESAPAVAGAARPVMFALVAARGMSMAASRHSRSG